MIIKIGYRDYAVTYDTFNHQKLAYPEEAGECYGAIDLENETITLNRAYSRDKIKSTLIHEVLHGIAYMYGIKLSEKKTRSLADAIYTTLKANDMGDCIQLPEDPEKEGTK